MALKTKNKKSVTKVKANVGRPASPSSEQSEKKKKGNKPVVVFLPKTLHARVKLGCIALSTNFSTIIRELLEQWADEKKKAIASVINMTPSDEDEVEDEEENETEESDEDEEESDEDEEEDED